MFRVAIRTFAMALAPCGAFPLHTPPWGTSQHHDWCALGCCDSVTMLVLTTEHTGAIGGALRQLVLLATLNICCSGVLKRTIKQTPILLNSSHWLWKTQESTGCHSRSPDWVHTSSLQSLAPPLPKPFEQWPICVVVWPLLCFLCAQSTRSSLWRFPKCPTSFLVALLSFA